MRLSHLSKRERGALRAFVEGVVELLPGEIERIVLFGSKARRDNGSRVSDTDVAVVLSGEKTPRLRLAVAGPAFEPILRYGVDISPLLISSSAFRTNAPLIQRIKREGILLWSLKRNLFAAA